MSFWKNKKVIVTGGAGFLGSRIVKRVKDAGATVLVPRSAAVDLVKSDNAFSLFDTFTPDIVIHCAAKVGGIGANAKHPATFFYQNLMMGVNVVEMCRLFHVPKLVLIGTICSYPKITPVPFRECDLWNGYPEETNAPYGIAKKALLTMAQAYRAEHKLNAIYLLPVNLYGPGDNFATDSSHVIPAIIRKVHEAKANGDREIVCWGTGKPTREFLYVDDAAEAIVLAAEKYDKPEPMNIGAGFEITIKDLVNAIARLMHYHGGIKWDASKPDGQPRRCLDTTKAAREIGWKAKTQFLDGLQAEIDWYVKARAEA